MNERPSAETLIEEVSAPVLALAAAVSLAVRIEPQLLRKIRLELLPSLDAGVEADLWFSTLVESRGPAGILFRRQEALELRTRLAADRAKLDAAWRVIANLHRNISPAIFAEEKLAYLTLSEKPGEASELLRSMVATMASGRGRELAGWAARAIGRFPSSARFSDEGQMLAFGASLRLSGGIIEDRPTNEQAAEWSSWLAPEGLEHMAFGVVLLEDAVEFGAVGRPRSHRIEIPITRPMAVDVIWQAAGKLFNERAVLKPQGTTTVETGPEVGEFGIRTVLGDLYRLKHNRLASLQHKLDRVRAPRVNLTYDVETGGQTTPRELPFVVGVIADLAGTPNVATLLKNRRFTEIFPDTFDLVMASMKPGLSFQVENRLGEGSLCVELHFSAMDDFGPERIVRQVEPLRLLLEKRVRLREVNVFLQGRSDLEDTLLSYLKAVSPDQAESERLDEVVRMFQAARAGEKGPLFAETLLREVKIPQNLKDLEAAVNVRVSELDAALSLQLRAILHHPNFQELESAWRAVFYLMDRTRTSKNLKILLLHATRKELGDDFAENGFEESSLYRKVYEEPFGTFGGEPFGVLVGNYQFGHSVADIEVLRAISRVSAACFAPFLAAASPEMFNIEDFSEIEKIRDISTVFMGTAYTRWKNFRQSEEARYVALTLPRMLLRTPYGRKTHPLEEFNLEEDVSESIEYLWGNSAFALATRLTASFAEYGQASAIRGPAGGGRVEGLPVHTFKTPSGDIAMKCPTEIQIMDRREKELADAGFIPLVHCKGEDYAALFSVQSVQKPILYDSESASMSARLSAQLPYIFIISRFAQYMICIVRDKIGSFMSRAEIQTFLHRWLMQYVVADDDARPDLKAKYPLREARLEVEDIEGRPGWYRAIAFLRPHFQVDELKVSLRVMVDLPGLAKGN